MNTFAPLDAELAQERVLGWQSKLHRWAVEDERKRFGDLFNLLCDPATLTVAWERVKRNRGQRPPVSMARRANGSSRPAWRRCWASLDSRSAMAPMPRCRYVSARSLSAGPGRSDG